jgi:Family of unknown function (DUF6345)
MYMSDQLAIYRLGSEDVYDADLIDMGKRVFDLKDDFRLSRRSNGHIVRDGSKVVEIAAESGGVWAADESKLWKPGLPSKLLSHKGALARSKAVLRKKRLLPKLDRPFRFGKPVIGGTIAARQSVKTGRRENRKLDVQVGYPVMVGNLPVIGGGGNFKVTLGHQGEVTAYSGVWRSPRQAFTAKLIQRKTADKQFRALTRKLKIASFDARLAYYAAPSFHNQEFLYPVYVYAATALIRDQRVPLRQIILPATDFGPAVPQSVPQPPRKRIAGKGVRRVRPRKAVAGDTAKGNVVRRSYRTPTLPWEAGTEWIGTSGGLTGSQSNAQGFVDEWAAAGWHVDFNWGDGNAWESDWRSDDDNWVDNVDFLFYTGHASMNGWKLAPVGGDGWLNYTEPGPSPQFPGDLWGQSDLEWMVIAACGPLQDEVISKGGGDVFQRWSGAFDGMHILLGYGAITYDNTDEGRKLAQYCKSGSTVIDAWFRAAREIQPSDNGAAAPDGPTVWVGAMWVGQDGIDPGGDHAWGYGSVANDPHSPTFYAAMWTTC